MMISEIPGVVGRAVVLAQGGFIDNPWLQVALAVVASSSLGVLITQLFRRENTEADTGKIANDAAAIALKALRDELKEALLLSEERRKTIERMDGKIERLRRNARRHREWDIQLAGEIEHLTGKPYPKPPLLLDEPEESM